MKINKLPNKELKKMFYEIFLEDLSQEVGMYMKVRGIRKKALYESISAELKRRKICSDYSTFRRLLDNDSSRPIAARSNLYDYLYEHLDMVNWEKDYYERKKERQKKMVGILNLMVNDDIEEKRQFTTKDAIFREMLNFKG